MGLARSRSGTAAMFGVPAGSTHEIFKRVAFVPEVKDLYPYARADAMIRMTRGFFPRWIHELERHLVERFDLPLRQRCNKLSKGTRSKLALLLAVCRRCELLVLDEPTDGLDPLGIEDTLRLLVEQAAEHGTTIFFSSHQLSDIEQIADHIVIIRRGQCVVECAPRGNRHYGDGLGARNDQGNLFRSGEGIMIWYRHWVEMRLGVLLFAGLCLWLGISIVGPLVGLVLPLVTERFSPALLSLIQSG